MVSLIKCIPWSMTYVRKCPNFGQNSFAQKFGGNYHCVGLKGLSFHPFGSVICCHQYIFLANILAYGFNGTNKI